MYWTHNFLIISKGKKHSLLLSFDARIDVHNCTLIFTKLNQVYPTQIAEIRCQQEKQILYNKHKNFMKKVMAMNHDPLTHLPFASSDHHFPSLCVPQCHRASF